MDFDFVDTKSGKARLVLTETEEGAWFDFEHPEIQFLKSSGQFLWPSWRDGNSTFTSTVSTSKIRWRRTRSWSGSWRRATTKYWASRVSTRHRVRCSSRRITMIRGRRISTRFNLTDPGSKP